MFNSLRTEVFLEKFRKCIFIDTLPRSTTRATETKIWPDVEEQSPRGERTDDFTHQNARRMHITSTKLICWLKEPRIWLMGPLLQGQ
jgi:hypothetical protein